MIFARRPALRPLKLGAIRAGLETLYYSGAHRLARPLLAGVGAILAFHRVRPPRAVGFRPNRHLEISPAFLADAVRTVRTRGIDIVSIDEAHRRLAERDFARRFVVLTFDDGYRDNLRYAWPILQSHEAPFTVYVASRFADGTGILWWMALEAAIARSDKIVATIDGQPRVFACITPAAKAATWDALYASLVAERDEDRMEERVREIALQGGIDPAEQCRDACMTWNELAGLRENGLVTIGAHTIRHPILARLPIDEAWAEIEGSARRIETKLGVRPRHFAYPMGSATAAGAREFALANDAGYKTAVTTRPGVIFADHRRVPMALPRLSVNGEFQKLRYLDVLLSGAPTALWNGFRRVAAA